MSHCHSGVMPCILSLPAVHTDPFVTATNPKQGLISKREHLPSAVKFYYDPAHPESLAPFPS